MTAEMDEARGLLRRCAEECGASTLGVLQGKDGYLAAHALAVSGPSDKDTLLKQFRESLHKVRCTSSMLWQMFQCRAELPSPRPTSDTQCSVVVRYIGGPVGTMGTQWKHKPLLSSVTLCPQHPALL